ncbi:unnamed protein product [Allacma fusca]|uniref:Enhancer of split mgamma protein n=1 Tax=Allacma fusca TaxID=39272 RepID=A0A8J2PXC7_9HEXA|nr:unnamed protein product [Allacma fusca]
MAAIVAQEEQPISRTYQYRKVMKPMLERKRRARINRCLDELKELLVGALQAEGESVSRLEKADVLELTVRHLHKLRRSQQLTESGASDRFKSGFIHCANEVSKYMTTVSSSVDISVSSRLLSHLDGCIRHIDSQTSKYPPGNLLSPASSGGLNILTSYTPPASPISSPKNNLNSQVSLLNLSHPKLYAYLPTASASSGESLSPVPAHHYSPGSAYHGGSHANNNKPLALTSGNKHLEMYPSTSPMMEDEPFDLSNNVWRPW